MRPILAVTLHRHLTCDRYRGGPLAGTARTVLRYNPVSAIHRSYHLCGSILVTQLLRVRLDQSKVNISGYCIGRDQQHGRTMQVRG